MTTLAHFVAIALIILPFVHGQQVNWCSDNKVDAAMTYDSKVYIFRDGFIWSFPVTKSTKLPLPLPEISKAKAVSMTFPEISPVSSLTAATELASPQDGFLLFVENKVHLYKSMSDRLPHHKWNIADLLYRPGDINNPYDVPAFVDAVWFNHHDKELIIFVGRKYFVTSFTPSKTGDPKDHRFVPVIKDVKIIQEFKIHTTIDAAFSLGSQGILTIANWFYVLPEEDWVSPSAPYGAELSFGSSTLKSGLFAVKEACAMTDEIFRNFQIKIDREQPLEDRLEEGRFLSAPRGREAARARHNALRQGKPVPTKPPKTKGKKSSADRPGYQSLIVVLTWTLGALVTIKYF